MMCFLLIKPFNVHTFTIKLVLLLEVLLVFIELQNLLF